MLVMGGVPRAGSRVNRPEGAAGLACVRWPSRFRKLALSGTTSRATCFTSYFIEASWRTFFPPPAFRSFLGRLPQEGGPLSDLLVVIFGQKTRTKSSRALTRRLSPALEQRLAGFVGHERGRDVGAVFFQAEANRRQMFLCRFQAQSSGATPPLAKERAADVRIRSAWPALSSSEGRLSRRSSTSGSPTR